MNSIIKSSVTVIILGLLLILSGLFFEVSEGYYGGVGIASGAALTLGLTLIYDKLR